MQRIIDSGAIHQSLSIWGDYLITDMQIAYRTAVVGDIAVLDRCGIIISGTIIPYVKPSYFSYICINLETREIYENTFKHIDNCTVILLGGDNNYIHIDEAPLMLAHTADAASIAAAQSNKKSAASV
jgi:hypothetical protein